MNGSLFFFAIVRIIPRPEINMRINSKPMVKIISELLKNLGGIEKIISKSGRSGQSIEMVGK